MKRATTKLLRCLACGSDDLAVTGEGEDGQREEVEEGRLGCAACGATYPVVRGIPRFVARENYASTFGFQWNAHRVTQLDSHTGLSLSSDRLFLVSRWPRRMEGEVILEAGSGAGRFTEVLLGTGATVVSFDLSDAVEANRSNNGDHPNLHLFQGDIFNLPIAKRSFGKVLCLGVIQHTPDPHRAFHSLAALVRPGGELVIDVYAKNIRSLLHWKYLLRPITTRMNPQRLYAIIEKVAPLLVPCARMLRRAAGGAGHRLVPILEYSHWGIPEELNKRWAVLDTFDMYSPVHDHPQTLDTVREWYAAEGFEDVFVGYGPNGVIARGRRSA